MVEPSSDGRTSIMSAGNMETGLRSTVVRVIMAVSIVLLLCSFANAATYNIGPGKTYTNIGDAPWSSLTAGDTVNIYPKTAITAITSSSSTGTTITLTTSAGSIPYGSTVWFVGMAGITPRTNGANWGMPWVTCGTYGSGLYGTATGGTACSGNTVTISNAVTVGSGATVYFTPPYYEKLIITAAGTASQPITVQGVPDPLTGALPTLDPNFSTTGPNMAHTGSTQYHDSYGFVEFFKTSGNTSGATYVTLKGIRIQGGRAPGVTGYDGSNTSYAYASGAGIRFEYADHVTIDSNEIVNSDNGIFGADNIGTAPAFVLKALTVRSNHLWQNGKGSGSHQSYIEAQTPNIYEYNWYDSPAAGTSCSQLKDRSSGTVVRYSLFYPSIRIFDFVAAQNSIGDTVKAVQFTVPTGGFSTGATSLTFVSSVSSVSVGDVVGYVNAFTGVYASSITAGNPTVLHFSASYISGGAKVGGHILIKNAAGSGCSMLNGDQTIIARDSGLGDVTINVNTTGCSYTANSGAIYTGWGYPGSGLPTMATVSAVNTGTNTLTLSSPGLPLGVPAGEVLQIIPRATNPYTQAFVYGNVLNMDQSLYGPAQGALVHYGWDTAGGIDSVYDRAGTLYFYFNTVRVKGTTGGSLFQTESEGDTIRADNNIFYSDPAYSQYFTVVARSSYAGLTVPTQFGGGRNIITTNSAIGSNSCGGWTLTGWAACPSSYPPTSGSTIDLSNFKAVTPAQVYPAGVNGSSYGLQSGSSAIGTATTLPAAIASNTLGLDLTPTSQYGGVARTNLADVGAFQYTSATLTGITVSPTASVQVGATQQMTCTAAWSDSTQTDCTSSATWSSGAPAATINTIGLVTGVSLGSTTITAVYAGKTGSAILTVTPAPSAPPSTVIYMGGAWSGITIR